MGSLLARFRWLSATTTAAAEDIVLVWNPDNRSIALASRLDLGLEKLEIVFRS